MSFHEELEDAYDDADGIHPELLERGRAHAESGTLTARAAYILMFWLDEAELTAAVMRWVDRTPGAAASILNQAQNEGYVGSLLVTARVAKHQPLVMEVTGSLALLSEDGEVLQEVAVAPVQRSSTNLRNMRSRCHAALLARVVGYKGPLSWGGEPPPDQLARLERIYDTEVISVEPPPPGNHKGALVELCQGRGWEVPLFEHTAPSGPPHAPVFAVTVKVTTDRGGALGHGRGRNKKQAEQAAAKDALGHLHQLNAGQQAAPPAGSGPGLLELIPGGLGKYKGWAQALLVWCQQNGHPAPHYEEGPNELAGWCTTCTVEAFGEGVSHSSLGKTKRQAKQQAAKGVTQKLAALQASSPQ